jgi:predicted ribosome quality control (RQC) complex YloA/Tae2 family protein
MIKNFDEFEMLNEGYKLSQVVKRKIVDGYTIMIGKNAKMNDHLTFKIAKDNDIWLHASGVPGSHIVINVMDDEIPPKEVIEKAAELAAQNSKSTGKTEVVWTQRKNVTKTPDQNPGQVHVDYKKSKTITLYV